MAHLLETKKEFKRMQKGNANYIYKNNLDKDYLQLDMASGKYKHKGTQSDKVLKDKAFKIASNPKYDGYQKEGNISRQYLGC